MDDLKGAAGKKHSGAVAIVFIVLLAVVAVIIFLLLQKDEEEAPERFVTRENADNIMEDMDEKVADGMFECKMTTYWTFEDGGKPSKNAYVANAEGNRHALCFDVYESQTDELLYSSPMLAVGDELRNIKLDKDLTAGEYGAVVMYTLVDDDNKEVSTVGFNITILVRN